MNPSRVLTISSLIVLGLMSRFMPHPPNFTAITAIALMGASATGSVWTAFSTVCVTMLLSDAIIGFHSCQLFVYFSYFLTCCIGQWFVVKRPRNHLLLACMASSFLFFGITNFGEWLISPLYPKTFEGLGLCYLAAIPFLTNQLLGSVCYGFLMSNFLKVFPSHQSKHFSGYPHITEDKQTHEAPLENAL